MRCETFWKRIVTLCLTFWLGVSVQSFFALPNLPEVEVLNEPENGNLPLNSKKIKCVAADENLTYEYLINLDGEGLQAVKGKEEIEGLINDKQKVIPFKKNENLVIDPETEPQLYKPSEHKAVYQILLHKENCYELVEQR